MSIEYILAVYLHRYGQLPMPELGHLFLSSSTANLSFPDRKVYAPSKTISFSSSYRKEDHLVSWLSLECGIGYQEAADALKEWVSQIQKVVGKGATLTWKGVGYLTSANEGAGITIEPFEMPFHTGEGVGAEKVIRTGHVHMVRVGEEEKSSHEMEEVLHKRKLLPRKIWPLIALLLFFLGVGSIWLISAKFPDAWRRTGNYSPLQVKETPVRYQLIP